MVDLSKNTVREALPAEGKDVMTMPGHWVLARLGKKVLRPGGRKMTEKMLEKLNVSLQDSVVEFAPGLGFTAKLCLAKQPRSYTAIERDEQAAKTVRAYLNGEAQVCKMADAEDTGLDADMATVVYGEAMLTMQSDRKKAKIASEAARILKAGGRYGIHELCIVPNDIDPITKREIQQAIAKAIRAVVKPLTPDEWKGVLFESGFEVSEYEITDMHLLEPQRVIEDEGICGTFKILGNIMTDRDSRARVLGMRHVFKKYEKNLAAIMMVGTKSSQENGMNEGNE